MHAKTVLKNDPASLRFATALAKLHRECKRPDQGIPESQLAYELSYDNESASEFKEIARSLDQMGLVWRKAVDRGGKVFNVIWPHLELTSGAEYLTSPWYKKIALEIQQHWPQILVSVIATLIVTLLTLFLSALFGLFGLKL